MRDISNNMCKCIYVYYLFIYLFIYLFMYLFIYFLIKKSALTKWTLKSNVSFRSQENTRLLQSSAITSRPSFVKESFIEPKHGVPGGNPRAEQIQQRTNKFNPDVGRVEKAFRRPHR